MSASTTGSTSGSTAGSGPSRSAFAGGDQDYLRTTAYGTGGKLDARSHLHRTFATAGESLAEFEAGLIDWPEGADVLEVGCGTGRFWESGVPPRSVRVTLTDLSAGMVAEATRHAESFGHDVVEAGAFDVQSLPFADRSFDVVLANHMLYHVPDVERAVAELARVLRPDGVLLAATNGYGHMGELNDAVAEVFGTHAEELYEVFGIDTGERRLRERFASIVWHAYVNDLVVDDPSAVVAYGLSFPPGEDADADRRAAFEAAVERRFADGGGTMRIRTRAGVFVARRPIA